MLITRPMTPADRNYVLATWLHSATMLDSAGKRRPGKAWYAAMDALRPKVEAAVDRGRVWCVCDDDQPRTVHGWVCTEMDGTVLFLFVPKEVKHQGLEQLLLERAA